MTIEELKQQIEDGRSFQLFNLADEILALVEAANHCRVEDCTGKTGFIDTDSDIHGWELCRALDAFNAKMEAL